ncbi:unnamed protein product, partial [Urochloa humidicola]
APPPPVRPIYSAAASYCNASFPGAIAASVMRVIKL